jgi:Ni,Fe-hydrogenase maturation factor
VVFLDASVDGPPGEVRTRRLTADPSAVSTMAHFLDPRELLSWCESLYDRAPEAWLVSVTGVSFDYAGYALTPQAAGALERMLAKVRELLSLSGCR